MTEVPKDSAKPKSKRGRSSSSSSSSSGSGRVDKSTSSDIATVAPWRAGRRAAQPQGKSAATNRRPPNEGPAKKQRQAPGTAGAIPPPPPPTTALSRRLSLLRRPRSLLTIGLTGLLPRIFQSARTPQSQAQQSQAKAQPHFPTPTKPGPPPTPRLRISFREQYLRLRLETFPRYRQRTHVQLYRFFFRYQNSRSTSNNDINMDRRPSPALPERGSRRRRLAAMAGTVYRAGVAAASEIRDQYNSTSRALVGDEGIYGATDDDRPPSIPGAFPSVPFATAGDAQMVLFPMYAKRHIRRFGRKDTFPGNGNGNGNGNESTANMPAPGEKDDNYWHQEFARLEDEKAVVDVNVHGWIYLPQRGALTRKNRLLIGLARRMCGISPSMAATTAAGGPGGPGGAETSTAAGPASTHLSPEQQRIAREAEAIEQRGRGENEAAAQGKYSEIPRTTTAFDDSDDENVGAVGVRRRQNGGDSSSGRSTPSRTESPGPPGLPGSLTSRPSWGPSVTSSSSNNGNNTNNGIEWTEAELAEANANLLARLGPFLTTPVVEQPVTLFFYNETESQSRTVTTSDAGHFSTCAALDFVPTHVRVLVSSNGPADPAGLTLAATNTALTQPLSTTAAIELVEDRGVSLISDIDDTIKTSNIAAGAREIFRNTFVRDLGDMAVEGTRQWYGTLQQLGVQFHYCSNSPWQLFPMLATFFTKAGLPRGPLHLKQYSGMLQGIFEPVAERKRGTLERILRDFPHRRFLLVGDSGEADLEVYTDLVLAHPGRVLAIFIRDVTTPEQPGYFDGSNVDSFLGKQSHPQAAQSLQRSSQPSSQLSAKAPVETGPVMGTLIDLSDDVSSTSSTPGPSSFSFPSSSSPFSSSSSSNPTDRTRKPVPPPRPSKPVSLRGSMVPAGTTETSSSTTLSSSRGLPPPPPAPRRKSTPSTVANTVDPKMDSGFGAAGNGSSRHPLAQVATNIDDAPPLLPPRRTATAPSLSPTNTVSTTSAANNNNNSNNNNTPVNRKVDMWRRRLLHAESLLTPQHVALYTWRRGQDVAVEAEGIVREALKGNR